METVNVGLVVIRESTLYFTSMIISI